MKWTERMVADLIAHRLHDVGNGGSGRHVFMRQVRSTTGFGPVRTADAVSMTLWPSDGFIITAYEIKVSKSDWAHELDQPEKSLAWRQIADQFIVVAPEGIVERSHLPPGWGWLEALPPSDATTTLFGDVAEPAQDARLRLRVSPQLLDARGEPYVDQGNVVPALRNVPRPVVACMLRSPGGFTA